MNGLQLSYFLSADPQTSQFFKGIAMRDTDSLLHEKSNPALYILNTDLESGKGEHWCAAFFSGKTCEFFDPFGLPPSIYGFERILRTRKADIGVYNTVCVQSISSWYCGYHCLFFGFHRCHGYSMSDIIALYKPDDLAWNDKMVLNFSTRFGSWFKTFV